MPPASQPGSPEAPAFAEAQQSSILDYARNRTTAAIVAGSALLGTLTGGLAARVSESNANSTPAPSTQNFEQPNVIEGFPHRSRLPHEIMTSTSQDKIKSTIKRWSELCTESLIVNPKSEKKRFRQDIDPKLGSFVYEGGKKPKIVLKKRSGVKKCLVYGVTESKYRSDGSRIPSRYVILKPASKSKNIYSPNGLDSATVLLKAPSNR